MKPYMGFVTSRGLQPVSSVNFIQGTATGIHGTGLPVTFSNVAIGDAHPLRKIVVAVMTMRGGALSFSLTIGGLTPTIIASDLREFSSYDVLTRLYELEYPTGTTATFAFTSNAQQMSYAIYTVVGGTFQESSILTRTSGEGNVPFTESLSLPSQSCLISMSSYGLSQSTTERHSWVGADENTDALARYQFGDGSIIREYGSAASRYAESATGSFDLTSTWTGTISVTTLAARVTGIYS